MWFADRVGRRTIEAKRARPNDDSLRCWLFVPLWLRPAAAKCAGNSVTIGMDAPRRCRRAVAASARPGMSVCVRGERDRLTRRRCAAPVGRRRSDSRHRGRRPGDGRGLAPPAGARRLGRQLGRRAPRRQCRADLALALVEAFPDALPGAVAEMAVGGADGGADAAGDGGLEEPPQAAGGQAEPSDLVGAPDAEGPPATGACIAVAAKDPPGAHGFSLGAAVVKAVQKAVPNQRADGLAVRTRRLLEPLGHGVPFLVAAVKPSLLAHAAHASAKIVILPAWGRGGVGRGTMKNPERGAG